MTAIAPSSGASPAHLLALGMVAGMRSQLPLALLALRTHQGHFAQDGQAGLRPLRHPRVQRGLGLMAIGELIGDKLPFVPSRLEPGPLGGRLVLGALSGAALARNAQGSLAHGMLLGAAGAALGALAGYHVRFALTRNTALPDPVWALLEDVVALSLGRLALRGELSERSSVSG